ncbi:M15 family metallopeptidase [Mycobacterium sp. TY815]|uniref:M15 family metallopeptidase n=1 Tax=Mycobacterium sp. TY815 TaxID=3050581 RepID=UPI00353183CC
MSSRLVAVTLLALLPVLAQCSRAAPPHAAAPTTSPPSSSAAAGPTTAAVEPVTATELGASWHPGCPVEPTQLRRIRLGYKGFDGQTHQGELVVHEDLVADVTEIFTLLYRLGYPIERMQTVDHYPGADDELSMEDDNTSAFNCRTIPGTDRWAQHAYGRAIDLNPRRNPCRYANGTFEPHNAAPYLDRSRPDPGILHTGDAAVRTFTDRGWRWGGDWTTPVDYQHFERP